MSWSFCAILRRYPYRPFTNFNLNIDEFTLFICNWVSIRVEDTLFIFTKVVIWAFRIVRLGKEWDCGLGYWVLSIFSEVGVSLFQGDFWVPLSLFTEFVFLNLTYFRTTAVVCAVCREVSVFTTPFCQSGSSWLQTQLSIVHTVSFSPFRVTLLPFYLVFRLLLDR